MVRAFSDWSLGVDGFGDDIHRVLDVELAKKLGFKKPTDIRKTIKRIQKEGRLPGIQTRATVAPVERAGKGTVSVESTECWLTLEEALFVTARSTTPAASDILQAMIKVFLAARQAIDAEIKQQVNQRVGYVARLLLADNHYN